MAGTLMTKSGERAPMHFTVRVAAPGPLAFLTGRPMNLDGTITVGGFVKEGPVHGTLRVCLARLKDRELIYRLRFADNRGGPLEWYGRKHVRLIDPLRTMTTMEGRLYRGAQALGVSELTFDLSHLPRFLASFRLGG